MEMLRQLIYRNKVVVIRGQHDITEQEQVNFAKAVGRLKFIFKQLSSPRLSRDFRFQQPQ